MSESTDTEGMYLAALEMWERERFSEAFVVFMQGAQLGDANCMNLLGSAYGAGLGVRKSWGKSMRWHRRAWATSAQQHHCSNIAITYAQAGNRKQAEIWFRRALGMGDASAALQLAKLLLQTRRRRDIARAIALLKFTVSRRVWQQISLADWEEARDLLRGLQKSWRTVLHQRERS